MKKLNQIEQLNLRIIALKQQQRDDFQDIKTEFHEIVTSLTPSILLKQTFKSVANKETLIPVITSLIGGYLTKKIVVGNSGNPLRKILGNALQFAVPTIAAFFSKKAMTEEKAGTN